jgi:hypothetical protein
MLRDVLMLGSCGTASYAWLSAIVSPLVRAIRASVREHASRRALAALALAVGGAVLWTFVPAGLALLGVMLEPRVGLMLLRAKNWILPGLALGACAWCAHACIDAAASGRDLRDGDRVGDRGRCETTTARPRGESLYRAVVADGSRNVNAAPPSGVLDARTRRRGGHDRARSRGEPVAGGRACRRAASTVKAIEDVRQVLRVPVPCHRDAHAIAVRPAERHAPAVGVGGSRWPRRSGAPVRAVGIGVEERRARRRRGRQRDPRLSRSSGWWRSAYA